MPMEEESRRWHTCTFHGLAFALCLQCRFKIISDALKKITTLIFFGQAGVGP